MNLSMTKMRQFLILLVATQLTGCSDTILFGSNHKSNCLGVNLPKITNPAKIEGKAEYEKRLMPEIGTSGPKRGNGLGEIDENTYPIRFAEVEVLSGEKTIHCTTTDGSGNFVIEIPSDGVRHTVKINSISPKSSNQIGHIFVQNNPIEDDHYSISEAISSNNSDPVQLIANADGAGVLGGAFNILDNIIKTNIFLNEMTKDCRNDCKPFNSSPPAYLYWEAGINPLADLICKYKIGCQDEDTSRELSFFDQDTSQIFILGGTGGNIEASDTDHFDDSVIVHEYFHFVLTNTINLFSPGGDHNSSATLDPRLAFNEGMANVLSVLSLGDPKYIDTVGIGNKGDIKVSFDAETSDRQLANFRGQGNFIELSITRAIWDMIDPYIHSGNTIGSNEDESVTMDFSEFWEVLTGEFASEEYHFKDYGLFMNLLVDRPNATNVDEILARELQKSNREDYAGAYDPCSSYELLHLPSPASMLAGIDENLVQYALSDHFLSNDFHMYEHRGGSFTASVTYEPDESNVDIYVYREFYKFGNVDDLVGFSNRTNEGGRETVEISDLSSGVYLINVASVRPLQSTTYNLSLNGEVCPNS